MFPRLAVLLLLTLSGLVGSLCTAAPSAAPDLAAGFTTTDGRVLPLSLLRPADLPAEGPLPTIFYLRNLASPRAGREPDAPILRSFLEAGCQVFTIDFGSHASARVPALNRELGRLRDEVHAGRLLKDARIDPARLYLVPAGCRLLRDVVYYRDSAQDRVLALDLIYPSQAAVPFGAVLEFSCDNKDRMGNYSLSVCSDTLLEGFATEGFAVAMADHPVKAPYKGFDPLPECTWKVRAALRMLRATAAPLGHNGAVVPLGFSRGSGMALLLATTAGQPEHDGHGELGTGRDDVQGAIVMSGRFSYLDLLPSDRMIPRYEKAWGPRAENLDTWRSQGALDQHRGGELPPLFLTINCTEGAEALHQMKVLRCRLAGLGADAQFMMDRQPRGHKVTLVPAIISAMNRYLHERLDGPAVVIATAPAPLGAVPPARASEP